MKIALVDDEQIYLDEIERICMEFGAENSIGIETASFSDGESFLCSNEEYLVVFMDIYMNKMNGVSAAQKLRKRNSSCILIFLTSSTEHMPEAFSCHAFEYIVKPFSAQRVKDVLNDVIKIIPAPSKYLEIYSNRKNVQITTDNIVSAVTDAHYLNIELADGRAFRCRMTAKQFIEQTSGDMRFIIINKGIIVNADYISCIENNCCVLESGSYFPIRIRDCLKIEQAVRDYNFDKIRSRQRCGG